MSAKSDVDKLTEAITTKVTKSDYERVLKAIKKEKRKMADWVRLLILDELDKK